MVAVAAAAAAIAAAAVAAVEVIYWYYIRIILTITCLGVRSDGTDGSKGDDVTCYATCLPLLSSLM